MRNRKDFQVLLGLCIISINLFLTSSCIQGKEKNKELQGKWLIIQAQRNGKITNTLDDGYFEFNPDSILKTNIFPGDIHYKYVATETGFKQLGDETVVYRVEEISSDSMIFSAEIMRNNFVFLTLRDTLDQSVEGLTDK